MGLTCPDELQKDKGGERTGRDIKDRKNFLRGKLKKKKMKRRKKKKRKSQPGKKQADSAALQNKIQEINYAESG